MFVTKDELAPYSAGNSYHIKAQAYLNGDLIGEGYLDEMNWSFGEVVAFASRGTKVLPGEAICSGTVPTCCLVEHFVMSMHDDTKVFPGWLKPGDRVRFDVEVLGSTSQTVRQSSPVYPLSSEVG